MRKQPLHPRTAALNAKQQNLSKRARDEALRWLAARFPEAFDNSERVRPLKVGIMQDILEYCSEAEAAGISKSKLREAVVRFTNRIDYLTCLKSREARIDLFGNPGEAVSAADALAAMQKVRLRIEKNIKVTRKPSHAPDINKPQKATKILPKSEPPLYSTENSEKSIAYNMQDSFSHASRSAQQVMIKHKQTRQYDPDVVARLKEKLGLSQKKNEHEK